MGKTHRKPVAEAVQNNRKHKAVASIHANGKPNWKNPKAMFQPNFPDGSIHPAQANQPDESDDTPAQAGIY
jgi:hypothetical protein